MFWKIFKSVVQGLSNITGYIAALSIIAAAVIISEAVFVRKVLNISTIWQTEMCVFLLLFATFMGTAFVEKNDNNLNVDFLLIYLSPKIREAFMLFGAFFTMSISALIAWYAWPMWWKTVIQNYHSESLWGPPLWIPYAFIPFGLSLLVLQLIVSIGKKIEKLKAGEIQEEITRAELKDIDLEGIKPE